MGRKRREGRMPFCHAHLSAAFEGVNELRQPSSPGCEVIGLQMHPVKDAAYFARSLKTFVRSRRSPSQGSVVKHINQAENKTAAADKKHFMNLCEF